MTTREAFLQSVLADRHEILGRRLRPFCFDHWCILDAMDSPLLRGGTITMTDLQLAILACSTDSVAEFYDETKRPRLMRRLWFFATAKFPVIPILAEFNAYIDDHVPAFPRWESDEGSPTKCPAIFVNAARLINAGIAPTIVRRMSFGELLSWTLAMDEAQGHSPESLISEAESEALDALNAEEEVPHA